MEYIQIPKKNNDEIIKLGCIYNQEENENEIFIKITKVFIIESNSNIDETKCSIIKVPKSKLDKLKIYRNYSYYPTNGEQSRIDDIRYLHAKGQYLDFRPELGHCNQKKTEWYDKLIEDKMFNLNPNKIVKYVHHDKILAIDDKNILDTTSFFSYSINHTYYQISLEYIKFSCKPIILNEENTNGLYEEYPIKMYGAIFKKGLVQNYTAQPIIIAFSTCKDKLQNLDTSGINIENLDYPSECSIQEILIIGWFGEYKPGYQFYGIQNNKCCEGVLYIDDVKKIGEKYEISKNPIEMNVIYEDGILNS